MADGRGKRGMNRVTICVLSSLVLLSVSQGRVSAQQNVVASSDDSVPSTHRVADSTNPNGPDLQQRNPRYRVQPDDIISIEFPLSPELDQSTVVIQPDGYINLQSANSLYIQGMTVPGIVEALKGAYSKTLHEPIISVDLVDFQKPYFLISGQVGKPGQYDLRHDTTVSEGIAIAGGLSSGAKTQVFLYHRVSPDWVEVRKLSLKDLLNGKNANEDARLLPGDMVFVPEKYITKFRKYVPYSIGTGSYVNP